MEGTLIYCQTSESLLEVSTFTEGIKREFVIKFYKETPSYLILLSVEFIHAAHN